MWPSLASRLGAESGLPCSLLNEAEIENLAGWNFFGCAAESFLGKLDGAFHPIVIDDLSDFEG